MRKPMKKQCVKKKKLIIAAIILLCMIAFCLWQNNYLGVTEYEYTHANLPDELDGYTIVQISDLHNKEYPFDQKYLMNKIRDCQPDVIVITGDIVDSNHTDIEVAVEFAKKAVSMAPTYYITGNHEFWLSEADRNGLLSGLVEAGVTCLDNDYVTLEQDGAEIMLLGLDDQNLADDTLTGLLSEMQNQEADRTTEEGSEPAETGEAEVADEAVSPNMTILLAHEPQYIAKYAQADVDLVLSGHAHGGQFRLPFVGGVVAPDQGFFPEYTEGLHVAEDTSMIISRGIGNSVIPLRVFNCPEIVCVKLSK